LLLLIPASLFGLVDLPLTCVLLTIGLSAAMWRLL
jgi:hypothetical protein